MHNAMQLKDLVQRLKWSGISDTLESRLRQAKDSSMSYEELLTILFQDELERSERLALQRRIDHAKFEELKTFESFDMGRYSSPIKHAINDLMTGKFINPHSAAKN